MRTGALRSYDAAADIIVSAGDCGFSTGSASRLISRDVGTCVAVAVHAARLGVAGLLRFSLPASPEQAADGNSWLYAETGIPLLFQRLRALGAQPGELSVYIIGGAVDVDESVLSWGRSNQLAAQRLLWREGILPKGEDLGGSCLRSIWFEAGSGRLIVRTRARRPITTSRVQGGKLCHFAS
jgi:chemotaxis protein CheD